MGAIREAMNVSCVIAMLLVIASPTLHAFDDDTAGDKEIAYRYLDQVREDVGFAAFDAVSDALATRLALTLGRLDRDHLTSKWFIQHIQQVEMGKDRFYKQRKLTNDEVVAYLLPYHRFLCARLAVHQVCRNNRGRILALVSPLLSDSLHDGKDDSKRCCDHLES